MNKGVSRKKQLVLSLIIIGILVGTIPVFAGGQADQTESSEQVVEVSMSTWLSLQDVSKEMMATIVQRFEEQHPNIKMKMIGVPFENQLQQTIIAATGNNLPDIIHLTPSWVLSIQAMGALADLKPLLTTEEYNDIQAGYREAATFDDKLTYVPLQNGSIVVLANKELLRKAGLPEQIPETWEDFRIAVDKISALGDDIYGFGARTVKAANSALWFMPVLFGHDGTFEDTNGEIAFSSPGTLASLEWFHRLGTFNQTPIGMGIPEVRNLFAQGKVGFIFDGPWMKGVMRSLTGRGEAADDEYIVGPMPKKADGTRFSIANDHVLSISSTSKNKEAAMEFIRFLAMDPEITKFHYENMSAIPGFASVASNSMYQEDPYVRAFIETAEFASANPSKNPNYNAALEELAAGLQEVLLGGDPATVMANTEKRMKDVYAQ
jgi:multiple sugar transport system substrate-binding protein